MVKGTLYFLDLPVYRVGEDQYLAELHSHVDRVMVDSGFPDLPEHPSTAPDLPAHHAAFRDHVWKTFGGAWRYNEIIGYLRLHFVGTQVRGEYWQVAGKRIVRSRRRTFEFKFHKLVPELDLEYASGSAEVLQVIHEYVGECRERLKGRFIDAEPLDLLGPYINWAGLLHGA